MSASDRDPGSFRDPAGFIFSKEERIFRAISGQGLEAWQAICDAAILSALRQSAQVIDFWPAPDIKTPKKGTYEVIEHPRLPFISYPYEWSFEALKAAALNTLDIHLAVLDENLTLSDASAYNCQFIGASPIFIDILSFQPYREGMLWTGMRQFTMQFLLPLLLTAYTGVPSQGFYRGQINGLRPEDIVPLLPFKANFSWRFLKYIRLPTLLEKFVARGRLQNTRNVDGKGIPQVVLRNILMDMRNWVSRLNKPKKQSAWGNYAVDDAYEQQARDHKRQAVQDFASQVAPKMLWDMGCNNGEYAFAALAAGAERVIGWDSDHNAIDQAFIRAQNDNLALTPLVVDLTSPSADAGWAEKERMGLQRRANADAVTALAVVHHMALTANIPLDLVGEWLAGLAPVGLIEFVPENDPQVMRMLAHRQGLRHRYDKETLIEGISRHGNIHKIIQLTNSGRELIWFCRQGT